MTYSKHRPFRRLRDRLEFDIECVRADLADPDVTMAQTIRDAIDLRGRLGWAANDLGQAILRVSTKLSPACPSSFDKFYDDGYSDGRDRGRRDVVELWVTKDTEMEVVGQLVVGLGMNTSDVLGHLDLSSEVAR